MTRFTATGWFPVLVLLSAFALYGCGSSSSSKSTPDALSVDGRAVQGPVAFATIIADKNANRLADAGESTTTTDENGDFFDLVIPADYGDYLLVSSGGTDTLSGRPALPMVALPGSGNITPLTTLVALTPAVDRSALINTLESLIGGAYDADPSNPDGVPANFLALTKVVEETQVLFRDLGVTETADQLTVAASLAASIAGLSGQSNLDNLPQSVGQAVSASFAPLAESGALTVVNATDFSAVFADLAQQVVTTVTSDGDTVIENETTVTAISAGKDTIVSETDFTTLVSAVSIALSELSVLDGSDQLVSTLENGIVTVPAASAAKVVLDLSASNTFAEEKSYTPVTLALTIRDRDFLRSARFILGNVSLAVAANGDGEAALTAALDSATLSVAATDSMGNTINTNDVSNPGNSLVGLIDVSANRVTLDLQAIQEQLADLVAEQFAAIRLKGDYSVSLSASGAPVVPASVTVVVE